MVCHLLSAAVPDLELTVDWWSTHCATWFQVSVEPRITELASDLDEVDYFNGLNNLSDRKHLIQAKIAVNTEELRGFRGLHVLLQGLEQPVQQAQTPGSGMLCVYCYVVSMIGGEPTHRS